jgi:hypothetical protein
MDFSTTPLMHHFFLLSAETVGRTHRADSSSLITLPIVAVHNNTDGGRQLSRTIGSRVSVSTLRSKQASTQRGAACTASRTLPCSKPRYVSPFCGMKTGDSYSNSRSSIGVPTSSKFVNFFGARGPRPKRHASLHELCAPSAFPDECVERSFFVNTGDPSGHSARTYYRFHSFFGGRQTPGVRHCNNRLRLSSDRDQI